MKPISEFQNKVLFCLYSTINDHSIKVFHSIITASYLAKRLKTSQVAISSALNALERKGFVAYLPAKDRFDCRRWFVLKMTDDCR